MVIKVIKGNHETTYPCQHHAVTHGKDKMVMEIVQSASKRVTVELPRDGDIIYVMNDHGKTVDSFRWPPKKPVEAPVPQSSVEAQAV